ncbi:hypothetical protein SAMN05444414_103219 [Roseovarius marisflavi]|uniref:GmrSD restriction endonucleases N-terminal domain-containing protein n=1 Tax=Roseovarius marisflavi TaxID=1054996 RepID=A0A1M6X0L2_9RHOB|nr:DUF262 domain-containing protein [Roseovarius marisflavi]SHK99454.1 hypothetical protein SAMN05444414_103219 [Roseovarius marisflavi]
MSELVEHIRGRLNTDALEIKDIITDIDRGEIKVPKFQRPFVWQPQQALELIDSIARGYPVGSLLLWRTSEKLKAERNIGQFKLPETDEMTPTKYVLDGQQRLTVMYASLGAALNGSGFNPFYDLRRQTFLVGTTKTSAKHLFPLRLTYKTTELLNFRTEIQSESDKEPLQARLDALISALTGYRVPVVELRDLTVEEVCPIFERINSSGTKLSTFDLIAAATWTTEFDLADQAEEISEAIAPKGFSGITNETILKCIAATLLGSIKKDDILGMRKIEKSRIEEATESVKVALRRAVDYLSREFGIQAMAFLPYEAHLICLTSLFKDREALSSDENRRVRQWFWRTSFAQYFRGASETFVSNEIREFRAWALDGEILIERFGVIPNAPVIKATDFHFRAAISKAYVIALAKLNPRNITNGQHIDLSAALSSYNNKQFHHIFPQAHLKRLEYRDKINSFANICMLAAGENNALSDEDPNSYLPRSIRRHGDSADAILACNMMPPSDSVDYSSMEYADFLDVRSRILAEYFARLCVDKPS